MYEKQIEESHPARVDTDYAYKCDLVAMELVGERLSKREFVNLVRWLIMEGAIIINQDIENEKI